MKIFFFIALLIAAIACWQFGVSLYRNFGWSAIFALGSLSVLILMTSKKG